MHTVGLPRTCLGFTNFLSFVVGMIGFVICVWCVMSTEFFRDVNYTITKSPSVDVIATFVNLNLWLTPLTTILIPIAALAMMTSCCGVLGAGCQMKCAIKSYVFLVTVLTLVSFWLFFITGVYNIYTKNEGTRKSLQSSIKTYYGKEKDFMTYMWDYIMVKHECCGVLSYRDFSSSHWQSLNPTKVYPIQCCKLSNVTSLVPVSKECSKSLDPSIKSNKEVGCFAALRASIISNKGMLIFYIVLIAILYSILTLFAYCIIRGEPLLGTMAGRFTEFWPSAPPKVAKIVAPSAPLQGATSNVEFVEEQPKKVVKVVSAMDPSQVYTYIPRYPEDYHGDYRSNYRAHNTRI